MKTGSSNISEVDLGESNAEVHARLGDATGYVPREKTGFGLNSPPLWLVEEVGREVRVLASTRPRWWEWLMLAIMTAAAAGGAAWLVANPPPGLKRLGFVGVLITIGPFVLGLAGIWFAVLWPRIKHAKTPPLAIVDKDEQNLRVTTIPSPIKAADIVRLERVWVSYQFRRENNSRSHTQLERQLVLCVRTSPTSVAWLVIDDQGSAGLKRVGSDLAAALGVPYQRVKVTRAITRD
jgi:hypothetical protein